MVALPMDPVARVIRGLAGAPQNAVVNREPVIVEEAPAVRDPLTVPPPDDAPLRRGERIAHQDVVVQRDESPRDPGQDLVGIGAGGEHGPASAKGASTGA